MPVFRDGDGELRVVLVLRGPRGVHGGQVGLPGGRPEPEDASLLATALREADEEVGLSAADVEVLAELEPVDTRSTGFRVHPFLARIRPPAEWRLAAGEISGVVTPSARELANAPRELGEPPRALQPVECIVLEGGHVLWGLTLRLLDPLLPRLLAAAWEV